MRERWWICLCINLFRASLYVPAFGQNILTCNFFLYKKQLNYFVHKKGSHKAIISKYTLHASYSECSCMQLSMLIYQNNYQNQKQLNHFTNRCRIWNNTFSIICSFGYKYIVEDSNCQTVNWPGLALQIHIRQQWTLNYE